MFKKKEEAKEKELREAEMKLRKAMEEKVGKAKKEIQAVCEKYDVQIRIEHVVQIIPNIKRQ